MIQLCLRGDRRPLVSIAIVSRAMIQLCLRGDRRPLVSIATLSIVLVSAAIVSIA